jgi:hypothetical protein
MLSARTPFRHQLASRQAIVQRSGTTPNPSLEWTRSGMAIGPPTGVVHHPSGGPSAMPTLAPQLKR